MWSDEIIAAMGLNVLLDYSETYIIFAKQNIHFAFMFSIFSHPAIVKLRGCWSNVQIEIKY